MVYRFGDCRLDTQGYTLQRGGQVVRLRAKAFQVLRYLLEQRDRTVLKSELCAQVWPQAFISDATLESTVRAVRRAIGDSGRTQQLIQTVYGYGYRFIAAVEVCADMPPGTAGDAGRSPPGSASVSSPDKDLNAALVPRAPESAGGDGSPSATDLRDEGPPTPQMVASELTPERPAGASPVWEQKLVAVLAIECTFPTATAGKAATSEPWTATRRWEQALAAKVQEFGGVVLQRSPSLLLVAFGIPQTLEQLPQRAVQAALALRHLSHLIREGTDREPGPALRLAVHWGLLVVDVQASDPTAQLRAIGDTLAWPVRLLGQAAPEEILLSPELGALVEGWCEVQAREVPIRIGEPGWTTIYSVVGNRPRGTHLELHRRRPLSRFIGRDRELALLRELLPQVEGGRGQVVGMIGEPGVGKSRLCHEFIRGALAPPWRILEAQGTAYTQGTPYRPIIDMLKGYFRLDDREALPTVCEKVTTTLCNVDDALTPTLPAFLALFDVSVEDSQWQGLEAPQRRQRTLDAVKRLLLWDSQRHPLLLVVENLHWIDTETQAVLDTLVESLPAARLFLLVTYRPEYRHNWANKTYYTQLRLDPLLREGAQALVDDLLGYDARLAPLKHHLLEQTAGNPFFLEESVRELVETQVLVGERGAYHLAKALSSLQVPATVQAVLAARIDRLPSEVKRLLQAAAVIGREVSCPLLHAIANVGEGDFHSSLAHLQAAEFLYETRLAPDLEYTFKHALTQEVAYGSLLRIHRRGLHARIVEALEALAGDRLATQVERLAYHALRGELWEKALHYCRQAGTKAASRSAYREAVAFYEQALEALQHLPETLDTLDQAIDLRLHLSGALWPLGNYAQRFEYLRQAETLAEAIDDKLRLGRLSSAMIHHFRLMGDEDRLMEYGQRALAVARAVGDFPLELHTTQLLGRAYYDMADYQQAIRMFREVAALAGDQSREQFDRAGLVSVLSRTWLALSLAECGEFVEGIAHSEEAVRIAQALDEPYSLLQADLGVGTVYLTRGDLPNAIRTLERDLEFYHTWDLPLLFPWITSHLAYAYALTGRVCEALPLLEHAMKQAISLRSGSFPRWVAWLSEACFLAGKFEDALHLAGRAVELPHTHIGRAHQARALRLLSDIEAQCDPPRVEPAEERYRQAMALAEKLGMRPLLAHCHCGLGTLYGKIGWPEQAHAELAAAIDLYRAMQMTFWLSQAEAALAHLGGRELSGQGVQ